MIILHYENNWYLFHHIQPILLQNWILLLCYPNPVPIPFIDLRQPGLMTQLLLVWWYQCNINTAFMHRDENFAAEMWDVSSETGNILTWMALILHQLQTSVSTGAWRHNERNGVSNHRRLDCLLNHLFRRRSKKILQLCVTELRFPSQRANNAENVPFDDVIEHKVYLPLLALATLKDAQIAVSASKIPPVPGCRCMLCILLDTGRGISTW